MNKFVDAIFFQILRYSIGVSNTMPVGITAVEWILLYKMAQQQSLLGILFYGIRKSGIHLDRDLLLKWFLASEQIKQCNQKANKAAVELTQFFRDNGFRTCILKGQGNALNYPHPYMRNSGDVDIWLEGGHDKIMKFVNAKWPGMLQRYHHVEIPAWKGVAVEIHFTPSYMHAPWINRRMQQWIANMSQKQFSNTVDMPDEVGSICVPTKEFNIVYQLSHMYRHLFSEGIGLRQFLDYYFVLRMFDDGQNKIRQDQLSITLKHLHLYKFARAVMWVLHEVFALENERMIVPPDSKEGAFLLKEIMIGGNFGKYDTRLGNKAKEGIVRRYFRMTWRNLRFVKHYSEEALCEPLFRTWHFFWRIANR